MQERNRWVLVIAAFVFAAIVGVVAFNAGISEGIERSANIVVAAPPANAPVYAYPPPYYYGWHRPWGGGFFSFFLIILFWMFIARMFLGRSRWHRYYDRDEWHRRAHERMNSQQP